MTTRLCIYPGTFDPIHFGHLDIVERALNIFETVVIAIAENPRKKPFFTLEERIEMVKNSVKKYKGRVLVEGFSGLLVDFMKNYDTKIIIRGVRLFTDFEYELQIAMTNYKLDKVETFFMMPQQELIHISSTIVKDIAIHGGNLKGMVTPFVQKMLEKKARSLCGK